MNGADRALFHAINGWPDDWAPFFRFLSQGMDSWWVRGALLALVVALAWRPATRRGALVAALMWPLANLITDVLKAAIPFQRPTSCLADAIARIGASPSMGTASAHSANMMFVAVCFAYYYRWRGSPWFLVAALVGVSRVYVGAHFPSQVLLGWLVGAFAAMVSIAVVEASVRLRAKRRSEVTSGSPS